MATVGILGTFDTKAEEYEFVRAAVENAGVSTLMIDVGGFEGGIADPEVTAEEIAAAGGGDLEELRRVRDRGAMVSTMAKGAAITVPALAAAGRIDAILALGGSGGSSVAAAAMQALPIGFPKVLVSTMAAGDVSAYVGEVDSTMMYSVVDVAGLNRLSRVIFGNAARAAAGMAEGSAAVLKAAEGNDRPLIGMTMFGLTTPAANEARATLIDLGYEVLVFHATGSGGRSMEKLAESGHLAGVLDLTTTEITDEIVGGVLTAGPDRLTAAGKAGVPQVVSTGATDMVNFGAEATVPQQFAGRTFVVHNPTVTLMRTTPEEARTIGETIASKLRDADAPTEVFIPLRGVSGLSVAGGPFDDEAAEGALISALREGLAASTVPITEVDQAINDEGFGALAAHALHRLITTQQQEKVND